MRWKMRRKGSGTGGLDEIGELRTVNMDQIGDNEAGMSVENDVRRDSEPSKGTSQAMESWLVR